MQGFGDLVRVGIEGTGAYGAGPARLLARPARSAGRSRPARPQDPPFAEQVRPDRCHHPRKTALAGDPARTAARPVRQDLITTCANLRPDRTDAAAPAAAARIALRSLARRHRQPSAEITDPDELLDPLVTATCPGLVAANGAGTDVAGQLRITADENHDRLRRGRLRHALRRRTHPRLQRQDQPPPPHQRRRPVSRRRPLPRRSLPSAIGHPQEHPFRRRVSPERPRRRPGTGRAVSRRARPSRGTGRGRSPRSRAARRGRSARPVR
jgi:hypothetical protein